MVDFPTAVAAGMALKIPLTAQQRSAGFDRIFVYGTRGSDNAAGQTLTSLLDAHHFTDGFALVPQGAPTRNTPDASSAYSSKDPDFSKSFGVERQGSLTANPQCDAFSNSLRLRLASAPELWIMWRTRMAPALPTPPI